MDSLTVVKQPEKPSERSTEPCKFNSDVLGSTAGSTQNGRPDVVCPVLQDVTHEGVDVPENEPRTIPGACIFSDALGPGYQKTCHTIFAHENPLKQAEFDQSAAVSHTEWLEWLEENRVPILLGGGDEERICKVLSKLSDEIQDLKPANEACLHNEMQVLDALIGDMRIVAKYLPANIQERGAFVLSNWPYAFSLRNMVKWIAARHLSMDQQGVQRSRSIFCVVFDSRWECWKVRRGDFGVDAICDPCVAHSLPVGDDCSICSFAPCFFSHMLDDIHCLRSSIHQLLSTSLPSFGSLRAENEL